MTHDLSLKETKKEWHGTLKSYGIGLVISFLLTMTSFYLVYARPLANAPLIYTLIGLAIAQAIVQLLFFLHIGQAEAKPRWETLTFCFTWLTLLIIVIGSLWVMHDLNHRMMPEMREEMTHD